MASKRKQPAAAAAQPAEFLPKGTVVVVTWLDAAFNLDDEPALIELRTYGEVYRHNSDLICIASEGNGSYYRGYTAIPAGWVKSIQRLEPA